MQCRRFEELILEYCENALPAEDRGRVEAHVEECAECRAFFEIQREVETALPEAIGKPALSAGFSQRVMRRVEWEREGRWDWVPGVLDVFGYSALAAIGGVMLQAWLSPASLIWLATGGSVGFAWWMSLRSLRER
jgi:anti-sigma factor RsiW